MTILQDFYIVLIDKKYNSEVTKSGLITLNAAYMEEWAEEHLKHRRQFGTILRKPATFSDDMLDIVTPGLPEPRLFVSGEYRAYEAQRGRRTIAEYYPSSLDKFDVITIADYAKNVKVQPGDKVYFDYLATDQERFLGSYQDKGDMYMLRVDEIYCSVKTSRIANMAGEYPITVTPQGGWCMLEPDMQTWEEITTPSGIVKQPFPHAKYLLGYVRHISKRDDVKAGDHVIYQRNADYNLSIEGKDYLVMREDDILCKI